MERPWMKLYTRDWLDSKELRRCSPVARAILVDLMCLAHEGIPYGYLADKSGQLTVEFLAARCMVTKARLKVSLEELKGYGRVHFTEVHGLFIKRMVEDEVLRSKRSAGGLLGGNPVLQNKVNLSDNLVDDFKVNQRSRERAGADSGSGSVFALPEGGSGETKLPPATPLPANPPRPSLIVNNLTFADFAERAYARHPKKKDKILAQQALVKHYTAGFFTIEEFERCHEAWCETEDWNWKGGVKAPTLAEWVEDTGYKYWPTKGAERAATADTPGHMNPGLMTD